MVDRTTRSTDIPDGEPDLQGGASREQMPHSATKANPERLSIFRLTLRHYEKDDMGQRNSFTSNPSLLTAGSRGDSRGGQSHLK